MSVHLLPERAPIDPPSAPEVVGALVCVDEAFGLGPLAATKRVR